MHLLLVIVVLASSGGSVYAMLQALHSTDLPDLQTTPGAIAVHPASPVAEITSSKLPAPSRVTHMVRSSYPAMGYAVAYSRPQPAMGSTSMHIHQTSDATVHTSGSGGGGGGIATTGGKSNAKAISYGGSMMAMSTSIPLAAPGARKATDIANITENAAQDSPGGPRRVDSYPEIPFPDPIGDAVWPLMLFACAFLIFRFARKKGVWSKAKS